MTIGVAPSDFNTPAPVAAPAMTVAFPASPALPSWLQNTQPAAPVADASAMGGVQFDAPRMNGTMPAMGSGFPVAHVPAMHINAGQPLMGDTTLSALPG